jgi:hypothetical protein
VCRRPTGRRGGWGRGVFPQVRRGVLAGGGSALGRIRTCNLLIRSQVLYPLSYERSRVGPGGGILVAEAPGFEPGRGLKPPTALAVRRHRPD